MSLRRIGAVMESKGPSVCGGPGAMGGRVNPDDPMVPNDEFDRKRSQPWEPAV